MDGRRFPRWLVVGGLVAAAGCKTPTGLPTPGTPAAAMTLPAPHGSTPAGGNPAALAEVMPAKPKKTGPMPDFDAACGHLHVEQAFADPPPANRDGLLDKARARYQSALKADPKHKEALLGVARLYARMGDRTRAADSYRQYLKAHPKDPSAADVTHEAAVAHARWGDWGGAVTWCDAALALDPENRTFAKTKGLCLARAGRPDEAVAVLCRVMPEAQARVAVAHALDDAGAFEASRQQLHLALKADPSFVPAREVLAELDGQPLTPAAGANPVVPAGHQVPADR